MFKNSLARNLSKKNNPIPEAFTNYFEENLPSSEGYKIYFDHGIETLDAIHLLIQKEIDQVMLLIENPVSNYVTEVFPEANHFEVA